jgi:hypothetical protein
MHTAIYAVTWTMIRYRIPLDVFFIMFAAYALETTASYLRKRTKFAFYSLLGG